MADYEPPKCDECGEPCEWLPVTQAIEVHGMGWVDGTGNWVCSINIEHEAGDYPSPPGWNPAGGPGGV